MEIIKEKINRKPERGVYWSRIHFISKESQKKTTILACTSEEYLWNIFKTRDFNKDNLNEWYEGVIEKWKKKGEEIFENEIYFDSYANTGEGKVNGLNFLRNEIKP